MSWNLSRWHRVLLDLYPSGGLHLVVSACQCGKARVQETMRQHPTLIPDLWDIVFSFLDVEIPFNQNSKLQFSRYDRNLIALTQPMNNDDDGSEIRTYHFTQWQLLRDCKNLDQIHTTAMTTQGYDPLSFNCFCPIHSNFQIMSQCCQMIFLVVYNVLQLLHHHHQDAIK